MIWAMLGAAAVVAAALAGVVAGFRIVGARGIRHIDRGQLTVIAGNSMDGSNEQEDRRAA